MLPPTYRVVKLSCPHKQWWGLVQLCPVKRTKQAEPVVSAYRTGDIPDTTAVCCLAGGEVEAVYETAADKARGSQKQTSQATIVRTQP